jgi:itaconate CoA-transferase
VVKVERPGTGDDFRDFARLPGWDVSPSSVVRTTAQVLEQPVLAERGMLQPTGVPGRQAPVTLVNAGVVTDADGPGVQGPVPALGADTDAVLGDLGYSLADIARLRANRTI